MKNIKKEYENHIIIYFIAYLFINIIILLFSRVDFINLKQLFNHKYLLNIIISIFFLPFISILSLIILRIIPNSFKTFIIFWKNKNALPSYKWYELILKDNRINVEKIYKIYGQNLSGQKQHDIWYRLYKGHEDKEKILNGQKDYLFARDLCITTLLLTVIIIMFYIIANLIFEIPISFLLYNVALLLCVYLLLIIVTRNCANRFVCNVIACSLK